MLDIPCGDLHWIEHVDLQGVRYIGADIVPELVAKNRSSGLEGFTFLQLDLRKDGLPDVDLVLCRDCLVHLSYRDTARVLTNLKRCSATWLLTTTFTDRAANTDVITGDWRPINLRRAPYAFPPPEYTLVEQCTEGDGAFRDKALALWRIATLPEALSR